MTKRRSAFAAALAAVLALGLTSGLAGAPQASAVQGHYSNDADIAVGPGVGAAPVSTIKVSGFAGTITSFESLELWGVSHANGDDLEVRLRSPEGTVITLMSDSCGGQEVFVHRMTMRDSHDPIPDAGPCPIATYARPTNHLGDADGPGGMPAVTDDSLADFVGESPNGTWQLWVGDDSDGNAGSLDKWSMFFVASAWDGPGSDQAFAGAGSPYPLKKHYNFGLGKVRRVAVSLAGVKYARGGHLDVMLVGPTGRKAMMLSDVCGGHSLNLSSLSISTRHSDVLPPGPSAACSDFHAYVRPVDYEPGEKMPAPAPPGPYGGASVFNGTNPNGTWSLYLADDTTTYTGSIGEVSFGPTVVEPDTRIMKHPKKRTFSRTARFTYRGYVGPKAYFMCKLDQRPWRKCPKAGKSYQVWPGRHVFRVRSFAGPGAFSEAPEGIGDPTAAKWVWRVKRKN